MKYKKAKKLKVGQKVYIKRVKNPIHNLKTGEMGEVTRELENDLVEIIGKPANKNSVAEKLIQIVQPKEISR